MPRLSMSPEARKHLIILIIALTLALGVLLVRADRASAVETLVSEPGGIVSALNGDTLPEGLEFAQITGEDYQNAVTLERLMILGMLGLVVLTWYYLKWRPPPDQKDEQQAPVERD